MHTTVGIHQVARVEVENTRLPMDGTGDPFWTTDVRVYCDNGPEGVPSLTLTLYNRRGPLTVPEGTYEPRMDEKQEAELVELLAYLAEGAADGVTRPVNNGSILAVATRRGLVYQSTVRPGCWGLTLRGHEVAPDINRCHCGELVDVESGVCPGCGAADWTL